MPRHPPEAIPFAVTPGWRAKPCRRDFCNANTAGVRRVELTEDNFFHKGELKDVRIGKRERTDRAGKIPGEASGTRGDDGYDPKLDLNADGRIGFADYILLTQRLGEGGTDPGPEPPGQND